MTPDLFTRLELVLWGFLESTPELTALVKVANRVKTTGVAEVPNGTNLTAADLPELRIEPAGGGLNVPGTMVTSSNFMVQQTYEFSLKTDELRTGATTNAPNTRTINAVKNAIFTAVSRHFMAGNYVVGLGNLKVDQSSFGDSRGANEDHGAGVPGWRFVTTVTFNVPRAREEVA